MRAIVEAKEFSQVLDKVSKVVKRSAIPILEGVLVRIANGHCILAATDLTTWLTAEIPAQGDDLGFVFQRTKDAARACRHFSGELVLEVEAVGSGKDQRHRLILSNGPRAAKIDVAFAEDFPVMPEITVRPFTANAAHLLERINRVKYTLQKPSEKTRAMACNVQFSGNSIFTVDGYRMAWDTDPKISFPSPFMVLPEALGYLKMFDDQNVSVQLSENHLRISGGGISILTRLTEECIFEINGAIPKRHVEEFSVNTLDFLNELSYLKEFIPATGKPYVYFCNGKLSMEVAGEDYSSAVWINGENKIGFVFDLYYMIDALRQFRAEPQVTVRVISPQEPVVIGAQGRSDFAMVLTVRNRAAAATTAA